MTWSSNFEWRRDASSHACGFPTVADQEIQLPDEGRAVLVRWLSNRYTTPRRCRMRSIVASNAFWKKEAPAGSYCSAKRRRRCGIYLDLEPPYGELLTTSHMALPWF